MIQNLPLVEKLRPLLFLPDPSSTRVEAAAAEEETRCQKSDVAIYIPQTSETRNTKGKWGLDPQRRHYGNK
jgi:hypothetical protein